MLGTTFGKSSPVLSPAIINLNATQVAPDWITALTPASPEFTRQLSVAVASNAAGELDVDWNDYDVLALYRLAAQENSSDPIDWSTMTSTVSYRVRYTTDPNWGSFSRVILAADVTSATITGLASNTTYYVYVVAFNPDGNIYSAVQGTTTQ